MKKFKLKITMLALTAVMLSSAGLLAAERTVANAEAESAPPAVGRYLMEQTDVFGNKVTVPVEYDGTKYILADYTRNIFVYNGLLNSSLKELLGNKDKLSAYTSRDGVFNDPAAISLYYNVVTAYDFYTKENIGFDYPGLNGKNDDIPGNWKSNGEIPLYVFAHYNPGTDRYNAFFHAEEKEGYILAGDGDANNTTYNVYRQGASLDVIAHEYQHGITYYMNKQLEYEGDSGALDEAFSDIFGMIIENNDPTTDAFWDVGETCSVTGKVNRSIKNPSEINPKYATTLSEKMICTETHGTHDNSCDFNGVHYNSTIISHLQYTAWEVAPQLFTRETIGKLWFKALINLKKSPSFNDCISALRQSATELNLDQNTVNALEYSLYINGFSDNVMYKVTVLDENGDFACGFAAPYGTATNGFVPVKLPTQQYEYIFKGWKETVDTVTEDITLTALFEQIIRKYTVKYVVDGKENAVSSEYGSAFDSLPNGYDGWFTDAACTVRLTESSVSGNLTLYAAKNSSSSAGLWIGIGIGAGVLLIGAGVVAVLLSRKKH